MKKDHSKLFLTIAFTIVTSILFAQTNNKPNIILIVVDDMGYSDIGAYGSEIQTPNIDKLAYGGLRLKEFYNNSICAPTRASLLTGQYPHKAGIGFFDINLGLPAYQGFLNKASLTLGEVLKQNGYSTLLSGKWHVGNDSTAWPNERGFDKFYGLIGGCANYFDAAPLPFEKPYPVVLIENNQRLHPPANNYYFTDEITNHATQFLEEVNHENKPFFLYLAYTAPHWPLQALPEDIAKYKGKYDAGWDVLRERRLKKQIELGVTDKHQTIAAKDPRIPDWKNITYDEKHLWKAKMEVYAAMIDRADQGIGKLLDKLKELKKEDNTIIFFISDNGASAKDIARCSKQQAGRNTGIVGTAGSFESQGKSWSFVSNAPFRSYKAFAYEGGISSPFIAWFPVKIKAGTIAKGTAHVIDIAPTLYELTGAKYFAKYNGITTNLLPGKSMSGVLFNGDQEVKREQPIFGERAGNRMVRKGKWKLVAIYPSYQWELYDLAHDRGETQDLAQQFPLIVDELSAAYFEWAKQNGVVDYNSIESSIPLFLTNKTTD